VAIRLPLLPLLQSYKAAYLFVMGSTRGSW